MRARDVMSRPVYAVRRETPIEQAATLLADHGFAAAPVVSDYGQLIGIVNEADLIGHRVPIDPTANLRRELPARDRRRPRVVSEVMNRDVIWMSPDADLADVADRMLTDQIRSIPIVERGEVVGIVSRRDVVQSVVHGDDVLGMEVQHRLDEYAGGEHRWTVTVADGVVHVAGDFDDDEERRVVAVLARTVPGVVEARLTQPA
jgi:CBS domain-containing protein